MKTAVSLPDDLFRQAEMAARRLKVSRSRLYARAIERFLQDRSSDEVTQRLNQVYARRPAAIDSALARAQQRSLLKEPW
jgi:metal-responsive CopG/Arc/MetJ family transcriptional regulator